MAKISGRNMYAYIGGAPLVYLKNCNINVDHPGIDIDDDISNTWGQTEISVKRWGGSIDVNYEEDEMDLFDAAVSASKQTLYIYPDKNTPTQYHYGTCIMGFSQAIPVNGTVTQSATVKGDGALTLNKHT